MIATPNTQSDTVSGVRFLDPSILARIGNLELLARTVVDGFVSGLHRAPHLGTSTDFAEHRAYNPGDDVRRVDWKLWARSDRYFVKEYEADTNTNFTVVLDVSRSMRYGMSMETGRVSKLEYGCFLAASLAYFSSLQRDRIGMASIDGDIVDYVPPSARHLRLLLHTLDKSVGDGQAAAALDTAHPVGTPSTLLTPMRRLADLVRRKSIIVVISDFYEEPDAIITAINYLRGRGNDIIAFHVLDPSELEFPFVDSSNFIDLETNERMAIIPEYLRAQYREVMQQHIATLSQRMGAQRIDYALFDTSKPLDQALFTYLSARERLGRVR
jgi:uncharacterized protein (DUF58 family)